MYTRPFSILSRAFFFLGVTLGLILALLAIWNHVESTSYFFRGSTYAPFNGLRCPAVIGPTDKGIVTSVFHNPKDKEDVFYYRAQISGQSSSMRTIEDKIAVPPHQTRSVQWTVDANDVDLQFFILVKITVLPNALHTAQEATCGIMFADLLGLTGVQISTAALILSLSGIAVGLVSWRQTGAKKMRDIRPLLQALGAMVLLMLLATWMSWWALAIALSIITVLLMVIAVRFAVE
jgi:hypothetical protein